MDFPIADLMDEAACYARLVQVLHPDGLACPRCGACEGLGVHRRHREPVLDYQCDGCDRVFNAWTDTPLQCVQRRPSQLILILRGIAQGVSTARLGRELGCSRMKLLSFRHALQGNALVVSDRSPLPDAAVEADEMDQNSGEKGRVYEDPADTPRRRANKVRGHGTFANDRPPVAGVVGRESGELRLAVIEHSDRATLEIVVKSSTYEGAMVYTDQWRAYGRLPELYLGFCKPFGEGDKIGKIGSL